MLDYSEFDDSESELEEIRKMREDFPNMPESQKNRLDLWEKSFKGDAYATMKLSVELGVNTQEQYDDFLKIDAFVQKESSEE
jgi:hypothetical protein